LRPVHSSVHYSFNDSTRTYKTNTMEQRPPDAHLQFNTSSMARKNPALQSL